MSQNQSAPIVVCIARSLVVSAVISLCCVAASQGQGLITLSNGSQLNGRLQSLKCESQEAVFDLPGAGSATVRWNAITKMSAGAFDPQDVAASQSGEKVVEAFASKCRPVKAQDRGSFWTGKIEAASALTLGSQQKEDLSGKLFLSYQRNHLVDSWLKHTITTLDLEAQYGNAKKPGAPRFMTNQLSYASLVHGFIKARKTIYPFAALYHNFSQGMRLEQSCGLGFKYNFRSVATTPNETIGQQLRRNIVVAGDIRYIHEDFGQLSREFSSGAAGISVDDSFHVGPFDKPRLVFQEHIEVIPAFKSAKALQARATSTLSLPLTPRFSLSFQSNDFFVRNAPPGYRQNYSKTSIGFGYFLGKF